MRSLLFMMLVAGLSACAHEAAPPPEHPVVTRDLAIPSLVLEVAADRAFYLQHQGGDVQALAERARTSRGPERVDALRALAVVAVWQAEDTPGRRDRARLYQTAARAAHDVAVNTDDPRLATEMSFLSLWIGWRSGRPTARRAAQQFVDRQHDSPEATVYVWLIRGEMAFEQDRFEQAATAYRYVLGLVDHPLYALALYRTAQCYRGLDRNADARQALREVTALGRRPGAVEPVRRVAAAAQVELQQP